MFAHSFTADDEVFPILDNDNRLREAIRGRNTFYSSERSPMHAAASRDKANLIAALARYVDSSTVATDFSKKSLI